MKGIIRYLFLISAVLLFSEAFGSRIPSTSEGTEKLIDSKDFSKRAWGAYIAGENSFTELQPKLLSILEEPGSLSNGCLVRSVLDAAIKIHADLSSQLLSSFYGRYPDETTLLLAQAPQM